MTQMVKNLPAGDSGSIPGLGRSPGEGNGNPLQYSCLENPVDGGAWEATVHGLQRVGRDWATSLVYEKMQVSGFTEIIPLLCTSAILDQ